MTKLTEPGSDGDSTRGGVVVGEARPAGPGGGARAGLSRKKLFFQVFKYHRAIHQPLVKPAAQGYSEPMDPLPVPSWLTVVQSQPVESLSPQEVKRRMLTMFEAAFPRIIDRIYAGDTLSRAVKEYPLPLDYGMFNRWVTADPNRMGAYTTAQEARAEVWADRMIEHAEGNVVHDGTSVPVEIERSKFANDTYKFLMGRQSRRRYGDIKQVEVTSHISIADALNASTNRVIEAEYAVLDESDEDGIRLLTSSGDDDQDEDDE